MDHRGDDERRVRRSRRRGPRASGSELDLRPGGVVPRPDESAVDREAPASLPLPPAPDEVVEAVDFDELYAPDELAAIEAGPTPPREPATRVSQWRRRSAMGAVLTGLALGFQEVFDPEEERAIEIEVDADGEPVDLPVHLFLDPDSPAGSLCIVARSDNAKPPVV